MKLELSVEEAALVARAVERVGRECERNATALRQAGRAEWMVHQEDAFTLGRVHARVALALDNQATEREV